MSDVSISRIARLVSGHELLTATPRERAIAARVRKIGERMEREGYLPALRRERMLRVMQEEAANDGYALPLCECGSTEVTAKEGTGEMWCAKCLKEWKGVAT